MTSATDDIRNIALVGHAGAGKTLLAEALLFGAGSIRAKGSLVRGTTVCDHDPQARRLQHSIDATICWLETGGSHVNLIDTPGYPDFIGRTLPVLEAVETAAVVVSAVNGVEAMSQRMMDVTRERGLCRIIIVNKAVSIVVSTVVADPRDSAIGLAIVLIGVPAYLLTHRKSHPR